MADDEGKMTIIHWATIDYPDSETVPATLKMARLFHDFADWLEHVGPVQIGVEGDLGLADFEMLQQTAGFAGVFAGDDVYLAQGFQRP